MKKFNRNIFVLALSLGLGSAITHAQCTIYPVAVADVFLDGINVSNSGISVAYNPLNDLYYATDGGGPYGNLITFNSSGVEVAAGIYCGYDFRGVWWNPNTDELEANAFSGTGIRRCDLTGAGYGLNTGTIILPSGQPDSQSQGDYDWDDDEIIYYFNGSIYRYSHTTGAFLSSYPITGLPVPTTNLSQHTIGYTGCAGQEIAVYDMSTAAVYTIQKGTGAYVATSDMPIGAASPGGAWYNVSFANGQVFIRTGNDWYGYRIFPSCSPIDVTASATEVCEGEMVTLDAEAGGVITWDGGITDGVPFLPGPPGTYTYTVSSDDPGDCGAVSTEIVVIGLPTVLAGAGDLVFCEDEMIVLSSGGDADVYVWNDGAELDLMPGVGTYTFELVGAYTEGACLGENSDEVTVEVVGLPTITASDAGPVCVGAEVTLTATGADWYAWETDGITNGVPFVTTMVGTTTYTVTGWDENGCASSTTADVEVVDVLTITAVMTQEIAGGDGALDVTVTGGAPAYLFDWDIDGTGDFDDTEDLTGLVAGTYTVIVQSDAGCSDTASFIVKGQLGIHDISATELSIYPNPTQGNVTIELAGNFNYTLTAINGDVLFSGLGTDVKTISLADLADGIYFVSIHSDSKTITRKIVKK